MIAMSKIAKHQGNLYSMPQKDYAARNYRRRNAKGLALWAKILIGLGVLCVIGVLAMGGVLWAIFGDVANPQAVEKTANIIAKIGPLPPNLKYTAGKDIFGKFQFAAIKDDKSKDTFVLMSTSTQGSSGETKITEEQFIESLKGGQAMPANPAAGAAGGKSKLKVEGEGSLDVGTLKMPYVYGQAQNSAGSASSAQPAASFIGVVMPPNQNRMVVLLVSQEEAAINLDRIKAFTGLIKGF